MVSPDQIYCTRITRYTGLVCDKKAYSPFASLKCLNEIRKFFFHLKCFNLRYVTAVDAFQRYKMHMSKHDRDNMFRLNMNINT